MEKKNACLLPGNAETAGANKRPKKTDFHWRKGACQTPHCCYISTPVLTSCVDNIPTVCAPRPLFSLLRLLVGLQPKHGPLFIGSLHISIAVALPTDQLRLSAKQRQHVVVSFREVAELRWWHHHRWTVIGDTSLTHLHLLSLPRCLFHTFNLQITQIIPAALVI